MFKDIDWVKAALLAGMGICVLLLLREWDGYSTSKTPQAELLSVAEPGSTNTLEEDAPFVVPSNAIGEASPAASTGDFSDPEPISSSQIVEIKTDVLDLLIDLNTGDFIQADLIDFHQALDNETPFRVLNQNASHTYIAKSGLLRNTGNAYKALQPAFTSQSSYYELRDGQDELVIELSTTQPDYILIKRYRLRRGDYLIDVEHEMQNKSSDLWRGAFYAQIDRDDLEPPSNSGFGMKPYVGAAITEPDNRYNKIDFGDMEKEVYTSEVDTGWISILQHYFISAWVPVADQGLTYQLGKYRSKDLYYVRYIQPAFTIEPGQSETLSAGFYVGPKDQYRLKEIAEHLDLTVDYSWLWWAAQPLYWVLQKVQSFVGNWGVAIIILTCLVKLVFFPLSAASYKSMARMRKLTPKMQALKERYGDDKQALSQETMKLYQKEKVNPLGGCLPILIQMPIFMALYWVLMESVEIRHAPLIGWIQDLSAKDPWYILPIIMGVSMVVQQRLNPAPPDPMQAKVMQFMPIMFAVMMAFFPAGLVLYWTVNNLLSIAQQWVITRRIEAGD